ncbi:MAG: alpha-2-macroglobulin, partial [Roseimicrobium sp.]
QTFLVAPLAYVVGWKSDGDLSYIGMDTPRSLKMIAVGPDLNLLAVPGLTQRIIHIRHVSVLTKQENGNYAYVSTKREQTLSEAALPLAADGASFTLPTNKAGEYRFELRDDEGHVVCATPFTVVGKGDAERSMERDAELEMKLASTSLKSGQPLEFSLRAPFTGAGLATIERDRVLAWQWIKQGTPSATHSITVPEGLEGTGYVNVSFVRALDSPEVFTSPLSYAVEPFAADEDKRRMLVEIDAPQRVKPGTTMTIGFKTTKPGRIVVYAVDEGIHQVTNYKLPDPLKHFMRKRALEVESEQILDLILPEFSLLMKQKAFGGSEDVALKMHLNPFKRRKEAPVVFWSGLVDCGPDRQEVTYDVPDYFAGSLKIMAVAVAEDNVGTAQTQATVKGPFVLTPNAPFFAAPGDEFTASLTVANNLEGPTAPGTIALKVQGTEHLEVLPPLETNLEVGPGKEATARFKVRVKDELGGAELTFFASAGGEEAKRSTTLSVRPASPFMTHVQSGYFRLGKQDIAVKREMFPEFRKTNATVSTAPLGLARGLESYLREYPYGCSEQITSRAMSRLLLADEVDFGFDKAEAVQQLDDAFMLLRTRQHGNGGFGYWDGFCDARPDFLSVYVTEFLTEARDAGYAVPSDILDSARNRMKQMARAKTANLDEASFQAAAIYLMTRNGEVTTNQVLNLRDTLEKEYKDKWEGTMSGAYLASTYMLLKQEKEGRALMDVYRRKANPKPFTERWFGGWWSDPQVRNAQAFALMCRHFPNIAGDFGYDDLAVITEPIAKHRFNTISSATSIMALKAYTGLAKKSDVKLSITEVARAAGVEPKLLVPPSAGILSAAFAPDAGTIRFNLDQGKSDLGAFYQVVEAGFEKGDTKEKIADGFEVFRELVDADGKAVEKLKVGQSVTVKLVIRNISPEDQTNVALLDLLPGSFEVEQGTLRPGRNTVPGADFVEVREDRNVFFTNVKKGEMQIFTYRIKPIAAGTFVIPPVYAEAMYDQNFKGRAPGGKLVVESAE